MEGCSSASICLGGRERNAQVLVRVGGVPSTNFGAPDVPCQMYCQILSPSVHQPKCATGQADTHARSRSRPAEKLPQSLPRSKKATWPSPIHFPLSSPLIQISQQNRSPIQNPPHNTHTSRSKSVSTFNSLASSANQKSLDFARQSFGKKPFCTEPDFPRPPAP